MNSRKKQILTAALALAKKTHYTILTREQVAKKVKCTPSLISHYFGQMPEFRKEIMRAAIEYKEYKVLMQGLTCNDSIARGAPENLKKEAIHEVYNL